MNKIYNYLKTLQKTFYLITSGRKVFSASKILVVLDFVAALTYGLCEFNL